MPKPRAILFDLDDTILKSFERPDLAWRHVVAQTLPSLDESSADRLADAIRSYSRAFWADPERHKSWRMRMPEARRTIVAGAFASLAADGGAPPPSGMADDIADGFTAFYEEQVTLVADAYEVLDEIKRRGVRIALITNGATQAQRAKIDRFQLAHRFDHLQIEEEVGFGKPDEQAYRHALEALAVAPHDAWMVGDNLEWEVAAPQRLGIFAIWADLHARGLPPSSPVRPDLTITALSQLLPHLDG
jgi:putative hydrolase of the HAD superfamily